MLLLRKSDPQGKAPHAASPNTKGSGDRDRSAVSTVWNIAQQSDEVIGARSLARSIISSISPNHAISAADDYHAYNVAVADVMEAMGDRVITQDEADLLVRLLTERLAMRRVDDAFVQIGKPISSLFALASGDS